MNAGRGHDIKAAGRSADRKRRFINDTASSSAIGFQNGADVYCLARPIMLVPETDRPPLVGITAMSVHVGDRPMQAVHDDYVSSVRTAGGVPVVIPSDAPDAEGVLNHVTGLVLSGGGDIDPEQYGDAQAPETAGVDPCRDDVELALIRRAVNQGVPLLGICRGCQVMNVALGGTLSQHLPATGRNHLIMQSRDLVAHSVNIFPSSVLEEIVGSSTIGVNSFHHQAVRQLAPDLMPVAWSGDGLIEAVQHVSLPILAVQWHPENMQGQAAQAGLFQWLVQQAAHYRRSECEVT